MSRLRKLITIALPAAVLAGLLSAALVEAWVRWQWDPTRGTPAFYLSDPVLGTRLNPGYEGYFAGVPVKINPFGFRDDGETTLDKGPNTFRIAVLGDSVTFGHGTRQDTTYPALLERRLREWRPDIDWEVWNLGVPGYNTRNEYDQLLDVGPRLQPDLVIVGFYPNDFSGNAESTPPTAARRALSAARNVLQRHVYSYELYKRVGLTLLWAVRRDTESNRRLQALADSEALLAPSDPEAGQDLTPVDRFTDEEVRSFVCIGAGSQTDPIGARQMRAELAEPGSPMARWHQAVKDFHALNRDGRYRIVFFINMAPKVCGGDDRFYDAGSLDDDDLLLEVLGAGAPVVSSTREFLHHRPSQMPLAGGHAIGNANRLKADVLFQFLRANVLPPLVPAEAR